MSLYLLLLVVESLFANVKQNFTSWECGRNEIAKNTMRNKRITLQKITMDMVINLFSTALSVALLNLIIYPTLAPEIGAESYGQMQSIMSVVYVIGGTLGITLCSTRLILNFGVCK